MFTISLYSPNDNVQVDFNTSRYPKKLVEHLRKEKRKIDEGFYSIRTWEMSLYNKRNSQYPFLTELSD